MRRTRRRHRKKLRWTNVGFEAGQCLLGSLNSLVETPEWRRPVSAAEKLNSAQHLYKLYWVCCIVLLASQLM